MDKERKEIVEWFVQFAMMELNKLRGKDKVKLEIKAEKYLFPTDQELAEHSKTITLLEDSELDRLLKKYPWEFIRRNSSGFWKNVITAQSVVRKVFTTLLTRYSPDKHVWLDGSIVPSWVDLDEVDLTWSASTCFEQTVSNDRFSLNIFPVSWNLDVYLKLKICRLFDSLPITTLAMCLSCKKYFINPANRKKKFCSPRCMWRFNAKRWRESHKEERKAYQKILMKDRYREKIGVPRLKTKKREKKGK